MQYKTEYLVFRDYDLAAEYYREFLNGDAGCAVDLYGKTDYLAPIHAKAEVWKREDSDSVWELADEFYLCDYTDIYTPLHEQVYQCLLNENNLLAHLVAYDMPRGIFENVE